MVMHIRSSYFQLLGRLGAVSKVASYMSFVSALHVSSFFKLPQTKAATIMNRNSFKDGVGYSPGRAAQLNNDIIPLTCAGKSRKSRLARCANRS